CRPRRKEDPKRRAAEKARRKAEEEARRKPAEEPPVVAKRDTDAKPKAAPPAAAPAKDPERARREDRGRDGPEHRHKPKHGSHRMPAAEGGEVEEIPGAARYFGAELHLSQERRARRTGRKKPRARQVEPARSGPAHAFSRPTAPVVREVPVGESVTVADLAQKLAVKGAEVVKALF